MFYLGLLFSNQVPLSSARGCNCGIDSESNVLPTRILAGLAPPWQEWCPAPLWVSSGVAQGSRQA